MYKRNHLYAVFFIISSGIASESFWERNNINSYCEVRQYPKEVLRPGCEQEILHVKACFGVCRSFQRPLQDVPFFEGICQNCRAVSTKTKHFQLSTCNSEVSSDVYIEEAVHCSCSNSELC